jgi:hypothetical protein
MDFPSHKSSLVGISMENWVHFYMLPLPLKCCFEKRGEFVHMQRSS